MIKSKGYFFADVSVMVWRLMKHITRSLDTIITMAIMPVVIMILFVYVFGAAFGAAYGGAAETGSENYVLNYQLPGILLITICNGVGYAAIRLFYDKQHGIFDRFHSMPIARSTLLWGHVLSSVASNLIAVAIVTLIAFALGFRSPAGIGAWCAVIGVLILFMLALTWVAIIIGLIAKTPDGATAWSYPLSFLPFVSSAFVPTETMPKAVRIFTENQPLTPIINFVRALLGNQPLHQNDIWTALAWCVGIMVIAYCIAMWLYRKRA